MWRAAASFGVCLWLSSATLVAQTEEPTAPADTSTFTLRYSLKTSALISDAGGLFRRSATGFARLRVEPAIRWTGGQAFEVAIEQRWRASTAGLASFAGSVLPESPTLYRIRALDWQIGAGRQGSWHAEVDRAVVHIPVGRSEIAMGRQAIGWGRGLMFSVIDLFSPFSPLEPDREWRRGVDAVRADVQLGDRMSVDMVGAFGDRANRSALAARFRGYSRNLDLELVGGRRSGDPFGGAATSVAVGDIELHGEAAVFRTSAAREANALAGGSYRVPVGHGVLVAGEYHYAAGAHSAGALAAYECSPELSLSGQWLQSSANGWGLLVPSATMTFSDHWSLLLSGFLPYAAEAPTAVFVQLKVFR